MKKGSRVTLYLEGQDDPIVGTVIDDQRDYLALQELSTPISKSQIITCTVISEEDPVSDEIEVSDFAKPQSVKISEGVAPKVQNPEPEEFRIPVFVYVIAACILAGLAILWYCLLS